MITSLFEIDRTLREASARLAKARRALAARTAWDEEPANPLARFRSALSKDVFEEVAGVPDPLLAPALRAHVAKLTIARVLWDDEVRIARAWSEPTVQLEDDVVLPKLPAGVGDELKRGSLVAPKTLLSVLLFDTVELRRRRIAPTFARAVRERLRDPVRFHADRRARAAMQLGVSIDALDLPVPATQLERAASDLLEGTAGIVDRFAPWDRGLVHTIARGAIQGWPAHLGPRWVLSIFEGTDLLRGIAIEDVRLPSVLGGASFARGVAAFGEAFGEAAAPRGAPFSILRPAIDLRPMRIGALFAMLVGDRVFARRTLGLGPGASIDHARTLARSAIASLRLTCAALRVRGSLIPVRDDLDARYREETARAWGEPLPPELAGVLPRITGATPARFTATLLAALDRKRLIETLDEDWHKNPRSSELLRSIAEIPQPEITESMLREATTTLSRSLAEAAT